LDQSNIQYEGVDIIYDSTKQNCNTASTQYIIIGSVKQLPTNEQPEDLNLMLNLHNTAAAPEPMIQLTSHFQLLQRVLNKTSTSDLPDKHLQPPTSASDTLLGNSNSEPHSSHYNIRRTNRRKRIRRNDNTGPTNGTISHSASKITKRTTNDKTSGCGWRRPADVEGSCEYIE
jgi:hypothetical protein